MKKLLISFLLIGSLAFGETIDTNKISKSIIVRQNKLLKLIEAKYKKKIYISSLENTRMHICSHKAQQEKIQCYNILDKRLEEKNQDLQEKNQDLQKLNESLKTLKELLK